MGRGRGADGYGNAMERIGKTAKDVAHARVWLQNDGQMPKAVYHCRRGHFVAIEPGQIKSVVVQFTEAQMMQVGQLMTRLTVLKVEKLTDHLDGDVIAGHDYDANKG